MLCCKIIANYSDVCKNFSTLLNELNKKGSVLWKNRYFYFANTEDIKITKKTIQKIFKNCGCNEIFLEEYGKNYQPNEDDQVNWWIEDKLIKIGYVEFEEEHQKELQFISQQLTDIENLIATAKQTYSQSEEETK